MKPRSLKITRARQLRKSSTDAETALWQELRSRQLCGHQFKRQQPIGKLFVDFVCLESRLVVELDGGQHLELLEYDVARAAYLMDRGFTVIRFWNNQVLNAMGGVKESILLTSSPVAKETKTSP
jgi:very-short-patch-repair endonuclease